MNAPALTVVEGLVLSVFVPSEMSETVTVAEPAVLRVTLNVFVPLTNAASAAKEAYVSFEVMPTMSVTEEITFQFASTALTVTLNAVPAVRAVGVPVFPVTEPGSAVSPGIRI